MTTINFRQAKKRLERSRKAVAAQENAARFGRTKAQRKIESEAAEKTEKLLNQHKLED
jgi:hypothetical protein